MEKSNAVSVLPSLFRIFLIFGIVISSLFIAPVYPVHAATTWTVNKAEDTNDGTCNADCSLREAVSAASSGDIIFFGGDYTILFTDLITIDKSLRITGIGHDVTLDGNNVTSFFDIANGSLTLEQLTMTNGKAVTVNCMGGSNICGGAINVQSGKTVTVRNSTFSNNSSSQMGGAIASYWATVNIENSTFVNNYASWSGGAVSSFYGTTSISNSTFSGNTASYSSGSGRGGAIHQGGASITLTNNTFKGNSAYITGGAVYLYYGASLTAANNIVVETTRGGNCGGLTDPVIMGSTNLADDDSCGASVSSNILLGTLGDYGGNTQTVPLLPGSDAIDAGSGCTTNDQRGISRLQGAGCDIGAFESQGFNLSISGGNNQSTDINTAFSNPLRVTVTAVDSLEPVNGGRITFTPPSSGASAVLTTNPVTISSAEASATAAANSQIGTYTLSANSKGVSSAADFTLTNVITISIGDVSLNEGAAGDSTLFSFPVTLSGPAPVGGISFDYATADNTAAAGTDYTAVSGSKLIAEGSSSTSIAVSVLGDYENESDETFTVQLSNASGAAIKDGEANGTILNDDILPVAVTDAATAILTEGATLNGSVNAKDHSTIVTFEYGETSSYGTSVTASPGTVTGSSDTAVSVNLTGLTDYTTYHYRVVVNNVVGTVYGSDRTFTTNAYPPTVTTGAATGISGDEATLNGTVNANGHDTSVTFEYGKTTAYGSSETASPDSVTGTSDTSTTAAISGLDPNSEYHFRIVGTNPGGTVYGADAVFVTNKQAPVVTTDAATSINAHQATITATVNARNAETSITFEYGMDTSYGSVVTASESPINGLSDTAASFNLSGLTPGTTYHYRVVAENNAGKTSGNDMTFHTSTLVFSITSEIQDAGNNTVSVAAIGDELHTAAVVSGNGADLDGTLSFRAFHNPTCSGTGIDVGSASPSRGIVELSEAVQLTANGLSFRIDYSGDSNYPDKDGECLTISDSLYPTVLGSSAATNPQDTAVLTTSLKSLQIQFNQDVLHGSSTHADSAENPANYLLVNAGVNKVFDTSACGPAGTGGLMADDLQVVINSVNYDADTYLATLFVNNGKELENGLYRLFICGTTSIINASSTTYINNHASDSVISFTIAVTDDAATLPASGFAPLQITRLPEQPSGYVYDNTGMWIKIPALNVEEQIVGVPGPEWDISWLGNEIGYLQGTAFPTWAGNSVLTGHAVNADGQPGPFADLDALSWGEQIFIHAWGQEYVYEIRSLELYVNPEDITVITQHEDLPWLTLITCRGYDEISNTYRWRSVVRAVLVKIQ